MTATGERFDVEAERRRLGAHMRLRHPELPPCRA
jgi:hypothetical protein